MHVYRDPTGRSWKVNLDAAAIAQVKEISGIDLATARAGILPLLAVNVEHVQLVLAILAKDQAKREGLQIPDFDNLDTLSRGWNALLRELVDMNNAATHPKKNLLDNPG